MAADVAYIEAAGGITAGTALEPRLIGGVPWTESDAMILSGLHTHQADRILKEAYQREQPGKG